MNWRVNLWVLCISVVLTSASYTMLVPFLPVYLLELGISEEDVAMWSGAVFSASFFVGAIMAPIWGKFADKNGKRLMAIRAGLGLGIVYFLGGIVMSPYELLGVRILQGFANGFLPASLAIVSSSVPKEQLGFSLGIIQTGQIIGSVLGPLLGGFLAHIFGMRASFFVAAVCLLLVTIGVIWLVKEPAKVEDHHAGSSMLEDIQRAAKNSLLLEMMGLTLLIQVAMMILQPVITLYVAQLQGDMEGVVLTAGIIFSLGGIAGAMSTPFWGKYGQKRGYFRAMAVAFGGAGIFNFLQFFPDTVFGFGALQFLVGIFIVGVNPSISATIVNCTAASFRGRAFGLATTAHQIGSMIGPLLGGAIAAGVGIKYVFMFTGLLLFCISMVIFWRHMYKKGRV
ncbi:MFS transporter [Anaerosinus massiliensis]|uniref:MFS transporter n=1 Tax=Massilibacillus massiliensis TaxID=1806837 RepID=UPI000B2D18CC|nr:MFS transporter [Massilibacillus massiliensis]